MPAQDETVSTQDMEDRFSAEAQGVVVTAPILVGIQGAKKNCVLTREGPQGLPPRTFPVDRLQPVDLVAPPVSLADALLAASCSVFVLRCA